MRPQSMLEVNIVDSVHFHERKIDVDFSTRLRTGDQLKVSRKSVKWIGVIQAPRTSIFSANRQGSEECLGH